MAQIGDSLPSTSLPRGEEFTPTDGSVEASNFRGNEPNESTFKDRQHQNLAHLIELEGITHNGIGASTSRCSKPLW